MEKETRFIISMRSKDGHTKVESLFEINGKEATFGDIPLNDKMNVFEALKGTLGAFANILLIEIKGQQKKEEQP